MSLEEQFELGEGGHMEDPSHVNPQTEEVLGHPNINHSPEWDRAKKGAEAHFLRTSEGEDDFSGSGR